MQKFAHLTRNPLHFASPTVSGMAKSLAQIVADNVRAAREARQIPSYRELAAKAEVAPNTVKNLETPRLRPHADKGDTAPRLDILERVARAMGYETWHMLAENFDPRDPPPLLPPTARELTFHRRVQEGYRNLDKREFDGNDDDPVTVER